MTRGHRVFCLLIFLAVLILLCTSCEAQKLPSEADSENIPYIGENGNWWIGDRDSGVKAIAEPGKDGVNGKDGNDGVNGKDGNDGVNGKDGKDGVNGRDGNDGINGRDGKDGVNGKDGNDGSSPYIGENGNWWIGERDSGVKAATEDIIPKIQDGTVIAPISEHFLPISFDGDYSTTTISELKLTIENFNQAPPIYFSDLSLYRIKVEMKGTYLGSALSDGRYLSPRLQLLGKDGTSDGIAYECNECIDFSCNESGDFSMTGWIYTNSCARYYSLINVVDSFRDNSFHTCSVKVTDQGGNGVEGAKVKLYGYAANGTVVSSSYGKLTDKDGHAVLRVLTAGITSVKLAVEDVPDEYDLPVEQIPVDTSLSEISVSLYDYGTGFGKVTVDEMFSLFKAGYPLYLSFTYSSEESSFDVEAYLTEEYSLYRMPDDRNSREQNIYYNNNMTGDCYLIDIANRTKQISIDAPWIWDLYYDNFLKELIEYPTEYEELLAESETFSRDTVTIDNIEYEILTLTFNGSSSILKFICRNGKIQSMEVHLYVGSMDSSPDPMDPSPEPMPKPIEPEPVMLMSVDVRLIISAYQSFTLSNTIPESSVLFGIAENIDQYESRGYIVQIRTSSMEPTLNMGDICEFSIVHEDDISKLEIGDIILLKVGTYGHFYSDDNFYGYLLRRIVDITTEEGRLCFVLKGDNNPVADDVVFYAEDIFGKYVRTVSSSSGE